MSKVENSAIIPLKHSEDLELVERSLGGDPTAVREFHDTYRPLLERVLMSRGVDRIQAEDLVADVVAECFGARKDGAGQPLLEKYEGRASLSTWMIRTTWNRWLDLKRRDKFRGELPRPGDDDDDGDPFDRMAGRCEEDDFLDADLANLMGRSIRQAFDSLPPEVLLMLKLSFLHGVSQVALARMWQCDQTRISRLLSSARTEVAKETMRLIQEADSGIQLEWEDFQKLCAAGLEL